MQSRQGLRQPLIIARQPAKARYRFDRLSAPLCEASRNDLAARQQHEAAFGFRQLNDLQPDAVGVGIGCRWFPCIALVDECHASTGSAHRFDRLAGDGLDLFRQCGDLRAFWFVGGRDDHASAGSALRGQHLTQCINRHVDFAALATLMPVVAGARVNDHRARCRRAPFDVTHQRAQIMDERLKDPGLQPALRLLRDGVPRRQIVGHHAPRRSRASR